VPVKKERPSNKGGYNLHREERNVRHLHQG
jgi:hypothetical protein